MRPHISNLRSRARALGLVITKSTTPEDARMFGENSYVLHRPDQDWMHMRELSLYGIRREIETIEHRKANT